MLKIFASAVSVFAAAAALVIAGATSSSAGWGEDWLPNCLEVELTVPPVDQYSSACPPVGTAGEVAAEIVAVIPGT